MASSSKPEESDYEEELNESGEEVLEIEEEEELESEADLEESSHTEPLKEVVFDRKQSKAVNEDVWDDSALIAAWDAAVEEYELYHSNEATAIVNSDKLSQVEGDIKKGSTSKIATKTAGPIQQNEKVRKSTKKVAPQKSQAVEAKQAPTNESAQPTSDYYGNAYGTAYENTYGYYGHPVDPYYHQPYTYPTAKPTGQSPIPSQPIYNPYSAGTQAPPPPPPPTHANMGYSTPAAPATHGWGMPPPSPPPVAGLTEDEELANLLMAWYYSGYYTGLYQARRRHQ